jgi:hypothetical protein
MATAKKTDPSANVFESTFPGAEFHTKRSVISSESDQRFQGKAITAPKPVAAPSKRPLPDFVEVRRELAANRHTSLQLLWEEYREITHPAKSKAGRPLSAHACDHCRGTIPDRHLTIYNGIIAQQGLNRS